MDILKKQDDAPASSTKSTTGGGKSKKSSKKTWFLVLLLVLLLGGTVYAAYYYYNKYTEVKENPQQVTIDETKAITNKISRLITLPTDETPTLATILDTEKLKDQPFFKDAQNGDRILIYTQAKKAIIYREKDDMIINVGPILINADEVKETKKKE